MRPAGIVIKDNKILVVKTKRHGEIYYLLPGGGIERGETIKQTVEREVGEETGYIVRAIRSVYINEYMHEDDPERRVINIFFITEVKGYDKGLIKNDDDVIEWVKTEDLDVYRYIQKI